MSGPTNIQQDSQVKTNWSDRKRVVFAIGMVLWILCFAALAAILVQWFQRIQTNQQSQSGAETGVSAPQVRIVHQKDGSLEVKTGADAADESPWEADGIADFSFTDCNGQTVTKQSLLGKPFIIGFVFTHCLGPCPRVTEQMKGLQERLKDFDFNLVTLTVDPARDTPETLLNYGKHVGANFDRWRFLTGDQADIYGLIKGSFKMPVEETTGPDRVPGFEIIHSTNLMLVDKTGRVVGKFNAQKEEDMARLVKDLKRLVSSDSDCKDAKN